jgi:hypothetical protein
MHLLLPMVIFGPSVLGIRENVVNVHDPALKDGSPRRRRSILADRIFPHDLYKFG